MRYRRKPETVEAFKLSRDVDFIAPQWFARAVNNGLIYIDRSMHDGHVSVYGCTIQTPEGKLRAKIGDFIIREPDGRIHPCRADTFRRQYVKCEDKE